jgi:hypothetical protein
MRLVANIRLHPKTGIYQFRKAVPEDVRDHLPEIPDLPGKPGRVEITKSLGTRIKAEANRQATRLDALVKAAIEEARQRLARRNAATAATASTSSSGPPKPIDPRTAFAALARWEATAIRDAEQRLFNAPVTDRLTEEDARRGDIIVALRARPMRFTKAWQKVAGFDDRLAQALCSEGTVARAARQVPTTISGCRSSARTWATTAASISPAGSRAIAGRSAAPPFSTAWLT